MAVACSAAIDGSLIEKMIIITVDIKPCNSFLILGAPLGRVENERHTVHAITQASRLRAIFEDMP